VAVERHVVVVENMAGDAIDEGGVGGGERPPPGASGAVSGPVAVGARERTMAAGSSPHPASMTPMQSAMPTRAAQVQRCGRALASKPATKPAIASVNPLNGASIASARRPR
jgi:hypothetical protein